ncbi:hypothetical protein NUV66_12695 [Pseudomonas sp. 32.2.56]|uniref:hypothetical protein n=1 Tax=Pseudomonas sp. 32.2.56 TaxID=2969303 RepID=UPI0021504E48|nr:hypothetical protein [Pseudomonas sp. 32.2.56]MCR4510170.1 hypothetical protein [Pseudomonas sp. 32.2.56]
MPAAYIPVCTNHSAPVDGVVSCTQEQWRMVHVLTPEEYQLLLGGIDQEILDIFFLATLGLFAAGFGVGLIIAHIRKLKGI